MDDKIRQTLRESDSPMAALAIAKKIGFIKKEVNKTIYEMRVRGELERANDSNPPTWRLVSSSGASGKTSQDSTGDQPAAGATATGTQPVASRSCAVSDSPKAIKIDDSELLTKILSVLTDKPLSAPDVSRRVTADSSDVKRVLYDAEKDGKVENIAPAGNKPLWRLKTAATRQAQFSDKPLYTLETADNGGLMFNPVTQHDIKQAASLTMPTLTTEPPVATNSASQELPAANTSVSQELPPVGSASSTEETSLEEPLAIMTISASPTPSNSEVPKTKPSSNLAAKFELSQQEKDEVEELLRSNPGGHTSSEVMAGIGAESRDLIMVYLEELARAGLVERHHETGSTTYKWLGQE